VLLVEGQGTSNAVYWMKLIAILFIPKAHGRKINPFPCYKGTDLILLRPTYIYIYIYIYIHWQGRVLAHIQGVSKTALQFCSKYCCVASVTKTFAPEGVQTIHRSTSHNNI
jgi:hypothetical protein